MRNCILTVILMFSVLAVNAQKVGLVLSGGGAKGISHIGVIKALEENSIPIDYVSGTSMGAIIGALYSIGYTPKQMEELIASDDFLKWAFGKINEGEKYFFKKNNVDASWINLDFSYDSTFKAQLPTNLISTSQMDFAFLRLFAGASATANYKFDSLMIPFRCVASDVYNNKPVIFNSGDLGSAVRASMTFPFYFKPICIDDKLLFDGGMYNNFPVDVMIKDFNPDIIIGSKVANNSKKAREDDLLQQIENMLMGYTNYSIPEGRGVLIEPDVTGINLMDFDKSTDLVYKGYLAASQKIEEIEKVVSRRMSIVDLKHKREDFAAKTPKLLFEHVYIEGVNSHQRKYISKSIKQKKFTFTVDDLNKTYIKLLSDENIESIYPYSRYDEETEYFNLFLDVKRAKKFTAKIGGNISSAPTLNQAYVAAKYKHLDNNAFSLEGSMDFGRLYSSALVCANIYIPYKTPIQLNASLVYSQWDFFRGSSDLFFEDSRPSFIVQDEKKFTAFMALPINNRGIFKTSWTLASTADQYYQKEQFFKSDTTDKTIFDYYSLSSGVNFNTLNHKIFANSGKSLEIKGGFVQGIEKYRYGSTSTLKNDVDDVHRWFYLRATYERYFLSKSNITLGLYADGVVSNKSFFNNYLSSVLSAYSFCPTPHSNTLYIGNYHANNYAAGGLMTVFKMTDKFDYRLETFAFLPYRKIIKASDNFSAEYDTYVKNWNLMLSTSVVYHSVVGPVSLSLNYYDKEDNKFYFLFNFGYILFNKRSAD